MRRIVLPALLCVALTLPGVAGCSPGTSTGKGGDEVLLLEYEEIDIIPGAEKQVSVKTGKPVTAEAPKDSGVTAKVEGGKVTVAASKDATEGTHEVKVKDAKGKEAKVKVKITKQAEK
jgi:hypothetical protein